MTTSILDSMSGILDENQITTLLRGKYEDEQRVVWKRNYNVIKNIYIKICITCQFEDLSSLDENGISNQEKDIVEYSTNFIDIVRSNILTMTSKSIEMRNAITLLLCKPKRFNNSSFLNWLSHRVSGIGNRILTIRNNDIMRFGGGYYDDTLKKVRDFLHELKEKDIGKNSVFYNLELLKFCQICYKSFDEEE